jgi:hypothetical protein
MLGRGKYRDVMIVGPTNCGKNVFCLNPSRYYSTPFLTLPQTNMLG